MARQTPESALMRLCMDYLAAERVLFFRMNSGAIKADKRLIRFGQPGMADLLVFRQPCECKHSYRHVHVIWLELKAGKNVQSEMQKTFEAYVVTEGHFYHVIHSLDDLKAALA